MIRKKMLVAATGLLIAGGVSAQTGLYLGGSIGVGKARFNNSDFTLADPRSAESTDERDTAYKLTLGYRFNQNWAIEGGYTDLGHFNYDYTGVGAWAGNSGEVNYKVHSWNLAAVGILPLGSGFSAFGKLGVALTKAKNSGSENLVGSSWSESKSKTNLLAGVGLSYDFNKTVGVRAEYEDYGKVGNSDDTGRARASMWSLGLDFRF